MIVMYVVVVLAATAINGMDSEKKIATFQKIKSLFNKFTYQANNKKNISIPLNLEFYRLFKVLPDEMKLTVWHFYNKNNFIHDDSAHNYIITYDQYFSQALLEPHVRRYKYRELGNLGAEQYKNCDCFRPKRYQNTEVIFERENNPSRSYDFSECYTNSGIGPNNNSNIGLDKIAGNLQLVVFGDQYIIWKSNKNLDLKTKVHCIHPEINKFFISDLSEKGILTVNNNKFADKITTEYQSLKVPVDLHSVVRFGPGSSVFINKRYVYYHTSNTDPSIIQYDYEQQAVKDNIKVDELFNTYLNKNPIADHKIFETIYNSMHKGIVDPKCKIKNRKLTYFINIKDFIYPTATSDYILIKFNIKIPVCECFISKRGDHYFTDKSNDHYALYNIFAKKFLYLGKRFRLPQYKYNYQLSRFKTIQTNQMHKYVYDFKNYQSQGPFHTFCYDHNLNINQSNMLSSLSSRQMVAIVPDDDINRLEQMILAAITHNWCIRKEASRHEGFEIIRHLVEALLLLEQDQNPFKQKRMFFLRALIEQVAKKLKIDLQDHINKHLNNNFFMA